MLNGYIQSFKNCCCGHGFVVILDIVGNCRQMLPMQGQMQPMWLQWRLWIFQKVAAKVAVVDQILKQWL